MGQEKYVDGGGGGDGDVIPYMTLVPEGRNLNCTVEIPEPQNSFKVNNVKYSCIFRIILLHYCH